MPVDRQALLSALDAIDPAGLPYEDWLAVGMALHHEGLSAADWDRWSARDAARHKAGDCAARWAGFNGSDNPVTGGTVVMMARERGWDGPGGLEEGGDPWSPVITADAPAGPFIADIASAGAEEVSAPASVDPAGEMIRYLQALFEPDEYVNIVTQAYASDGKWLPAGRGMYTKTCAEVVEGLAAHAGDVGAVIGDLNAQAGAWARINPLDGAGVANANVTEFRHCLVESDDMPVPDQLRVIRALELPVAVLVHSGGRSLHAVVRIDAADRREYDERVRAVLRACSDNGLSVDAANKNPARLSRLPGAMRSGRWQYIVEAGIGKADYAEWAAWRAEQSDAVPDAVCFADELEAPEEAEVLIEGMLAAGEKMLLAGPSKCGKSYALLELCAAFAEGGSWLGRACRQTDVLYINLELKPETRRRRMLGIYDALGRPPSGAARIHSMDLRGRNVDLGMLTGKLVRQAVTHDCKVIIIDPIYKVLAGDENSSEDVGRFCTALDYLVDRLGVSVIYCHHYSKGASQYAASMNRASGSSVFSRDADALVTLDEVEADAAARRARFEELGCAMAAEALDAAADEGWRARLGPASAAGLDGMRAFAAAELGHGSEPANALVAALDALEAACGASTAWRVEGTLRDFPPIAPFEVWYEWPLHAMDSSGLLAASRAADWAAPRVGRSWAPWGGNGGGSEAKETYAERARRVVGEAYSALLSKGVAPDQVTTGRMTAEAKVSKRTMLDYIDATDGYERLKGVIVRKNNAEGEGVSEI